MSNQPSARPLPARLAEAQKHLDSGAVMSAMKLYYELHEASPESVEVLEKLVSINLHMKQNDQAALNLLKLIRLEPKKTAHYDQLAVLQHQSNQPEQACQTYQRLILNQPDLPEAHFNLGYYQSKAGRFQDAIESYQRALELGIKQPEEIHLNIAVVLADHLRREDLAEEHLLNSVKLNPAYIPAWYNLANLYEDQGNRDKTRECFARILAIQPKQAAAMARLAHLQQVSDPDGPLVRDMLSIVDAPDLDYSDKIDLLYALGKAFDDCQEYDRAFHYYSQANSINAMEMPPYNPVRSEELFAEIRRVFNADWIDKHRLDNDTAPVFICGMFRSGSTLVEQILAAHPEVTAGGERDFFFRMAGKAGFNYPADVAAMSTEKLRTLADQYTKLTRQLFKDAGIVTDKRPDNFLFVGLIKTLFPKAKIIYTRRHLPDNCLSVYFVRLARSMNYAVNLEHIAHYYHQQEKLMAHWQTLFGDDLQMVEYDELVQSPEPVIRKLLGELNLNWHDDCLNFHQLTNPVKTASVWQVRKPLFTGSSGRWKNYERHLGQLPEQL